MTRREKSDKSDSPPGTLQNVQIEPIDNIQTTMAAQTHTATGRSQTGSNRRRTSPTTTETSTPSPLLTAEATARITEPRRDPSPQRAQSQRHPIFQRLRSMFHIVRGTPTPLLPPTPSIDSICHYHRTYGSRARKCRPPCSYAGICDYCGQYGVPDRTPGPFCPHGIPIKDSRRSSRGAKPPQQ